MKKKTYVNTYETELRTRKSDSVLNLSMLDAYFRRAQGYWKNYNACFVNSHLGRWPLTSAWFSDIAEFFYHNSKFWNFGIIAENRSYLNHSKFFSYNNDFGFEIWNVYEMFYYIFLIYYPLISDFISVIIANCYCAMILVVLPVIIPDLFFWNFCRFHSRFQILQSDAQAQC